MKDILKGYWTELSSRVLSSKKRLLKFFGIAIVPIIYAITCILGFWNPINNIGKAPVAIMNEDATVWIYKKTGDNFSDFNIGVLKDKDGNSLNTKNTTSREEAIEKATINGKIHTNTGDYKFNEEQISDLNIWTLFKDYLTPKHSDKKDEENTFSSPELKEGLALTNIHYISDKKEIEKQWKGKKYYLDLKIHEGTLEYLIYKIGTLIHIHPGLTPTPKVKMDVWTTYERNFIFGYYMKSMYEYRSSIIFGLIDKLFDNEAAKNIKDELQKEINNQNQGISTKGWKDDLILKIVKYIYSSSKEELSLINFDQQGSKNGVYGIGLGEFFICIGLFVGTFMQTFIYDRGKRSHNLSSTKWYITKSMLMFTTGIVQVTFLVIALSLTGYSAIGSAAMFSLWLWLLYIDLIFVITIQSLWYLFTDEMISKFVVVIYLVINIAAGSGTFPNFMQFDFFNAISYLSEFRYSIHAIGSIVYGIGEYGFNSYDSLYILQEAGYLAIFGVIMFALGLYSSSKRNKQIRFGSYKGKKVLKAFEELNMQSEVNEFKLEKQRHYNWNKMSQSYYPEVILKVKEIYPSEKQFKWFEKQEKGIILKPNESDQETISRNDTKEV
ncbi:hypothetical protein [Spiroplasma sp. BIUS-1]|uniref:hypothetical protein n=1 Tax=Spiroplasma sp. BIUS-1 TaxID=216964 RepID=UPI001397128D|nr:hypothetical protein [Spiroplasma sp. BIUS-1]QHX36500.1 hypothetical protein SBIUS_v1c02470 [Spiroplasma sp. BIUS-1]